MFRLLLTLGLLTFIPACGKFKKLSTSSLIKQDVSGIFSSQRIEVRVFYEPGAEPFAGGVLGLKYWDILEKNLGALFPGLYQSANIFVPKELNEMAKLSPQNQTTWSLGEVDDLARRFGQASTAPTSVFNVFFVKGHAEDSQSIIGFHISGTKTVVIFKDVIANMTSADPLVPKYVEQATLVHELGHALGLVNNGVPMKSAHQDASHGAHCSNPDCVMYWSNEGASDMLNFARSVVTKLSVVMFDGACLNDVHSY